MAGMTDVLVAGDLLGQAHIFGLFEETMDFGLRSIPSGFRAALEWLRNKAVMTRSAFDKLEADARKSAFTIAGLMEEYTIQRAKDLLIRSLDKGETLDQWMARLDKPAKGNPSVMQMIGLQPTTSRQPLAPGHAETVFRVQWQSAYQAAYYDQLQTPAVQNAVWGYEYYTVGDDRVRPTHEAMDGVRLPKGDPTWQRWWPPNGFRCRCAVVPITFAEAEVEGLTPTRRPPDRITDDRGRSILLEPDDGWSGPPTGGA